MLRTSGRSISRTLRKESGLITLDEGYGNTGSTRSDITFLDGGKGILRYRGYPIEELAANCDFIEVAYLLINGELPNHEQLEEFREDTRKRSLLHEDIRLFYDGFPRDAHPMAILSSVVGAMSTFYRGRRSTQYDDDDVRSNRSVHRLTRQAADHCRICLQEGDLVSRTSTRSN